MKARDIAVCAAMTALLTAGQYVLSFIPGVEIVTVLLLTFSYVFGAKYGVMTAAAFSLLRCLLFGFYPNVILLYITYYCAFAAIFGQIGKRRVPAFLCPLILLLLCIGSAFSAIRGVPTSALYRIRISVLSWTLFLISAGLLVFYFVLTVKNKGEKARLAAELSAVAAFCTVLFSLWDDILTPLLMGYSKEAAAGYFYGSFLAMLPQTVCAAVSVFVLFYPLKRAFEAVRKHGMFSNG